jgi:hypothetical protein
LIAEHASSAELLKPLVRGRDVKRWRVESQDLWFIFVPWHFPLHEDTSIAGASKKAEGEFEKRYPAIFQHLKKFKQALSARNKAETGVRYEWYALQRCAADYWQEFEKSKIVFPDIAQGTEFAYDEDSHFLGNTLYLLPTNEKWLLGLLNSKAIFWFYTKVSAQIRGGFVRFIAQYVSQIPIPAATPQQQAAIARVVERILAAKQADAAADVSALEAEIDGLVYGLYGLTAAEVGVIES